MITTHNIVPGLSFIEFEGLSFSLMCGCPPDAAKFLIKEQFIKETLIEGKKRASGPVGILLSDSNIQNGSFCNFSEFPILHMLFIQGMISADNPHGFKPKLIGSARNIESQLEYLEWGAYGITEKEDLTKAGLSGDFADNLLNQKLFFAFGAFRKMNDLIDGYVLEEPPVEVFPQITLARVSENYFKITYKDSVAFVDLNMKNGETCPPVLQYEPIRLPDAKFMVVNTGCGDGWDPYRPTFGSLLKYEGKNYLIDAGPNIFDYLKSLNIYQEDLHGLFLTHIHDDHFAGIVNLALSKKRLKIITTKLIHFSAKKKFEAITAMSHGSYEDNFEVVELEYECWKDFEGLQVIGYHSAHPVENVLFYFRVRNGSSEYRSYAHYADLCSFEKLDEMRTGTFGNKISESFLNKIKQNYLIPANLKKIDIGGGLIHGNASDFADDRSDKLVLGHTSHPLTREQLKIGQSEYFGDYNILIP